MFQCTTGIHFNAFAQMLHLVCFTELLGSYRETARYVHI